jgi:tetratricopeptide (TPR) repeat protein
VIDFQYKPAEVVYREEDLDIVNDHYKRAFDFFNAGYPSMGYKFAIKIFEILNNLKRNGWVGYPKLYADILGSLVCFLSELEEHGMVKKFVKLALEFDPENWYAKYNLGAYYLDNDMFEEACKIYREMVEKDPDNLHNVYNLASAFGYLGMYEEQVKLLEGYMKNNSKNPDILSKYAFSLLEVGRWEDALNVFKEYIEMRPADAVGHAGLAVVYARMGWKEECYREIQNAMKLYEKNPDESVIELIKEALEILNDYNNFFIFLFIMSYLSRKNKFKKG